MKKLILGMALTALSCSGAGAVVMLGDPVTGADLEDYRLYDGDPTKEGLYVNGAAWISNNPRIDWDISIVGSEVFYSYTFDGVNSGQAGGFSHWVLQLSDDDVEITDLVGGTLGESGSGDDNSTALITERGTWVKINPPVSGDPFTISFTSDRAPVWGDISMKGGGGTSGNQLANLALYNGVTEADKSWFIPRPNGPPNGGEIPEPSRALFGLLGVMGACFVRRRPRSKE